MDLSRFTALFLSDSRDHLRRSMALLLEWEREPASVEPVAELFRSFHSLKSAAATMGYSSVAQVAHAAENLLEAVRRGELRGSPAVVGLLLQTVDLLENGLDAVVAGEELSDAPALTEALERLADSATPSTTQDLPVRASGSFQAIRGPRSSRAVRVDQGRLDELMSQVGELVVARNRLAALLARRVDPEVDTAIGQLSSLVRSMHGGVVRARMAPLTELFDRFPRVVRDLGHELGKAVRLELAGEDVELDRGMLEELIDPLVHLLRNAVDHGIEAPAERARLGKPPEGRLLLLAERRPDQVVLKLSDDGGGIDRRRVAGHARELGLLEAPDGGLDDAQVLGLIARPGFSLKGSVTAVSGRGVGIDAVTTKLRFLGGRLDLETVEGQGTTFVVTLPLSTAIQRVLLVQAGGERYAIPFRVIAEATWVDGELSDRFSFRGDGIALVDLARAAGGASDRGRRRRPVLLLDWGERRGTLAVDALLGQQDAVIARFERPAGTPAWLSGATILPDGIPAFVLDPTALF